MPRAQLPEAAHRPPAHIGLPRDHTRPRHRGLRRDDGLPRLLRDDRPRQAHRDVLAPADGRQAPRAHRLPRQLLRGAARTRARLRDQPDLRRVLRVPRRPPREGRHGRPLLRQVHGRLLRDPPDEEGGRGAARRRQAQVGGARPRPERQDDLGEAAQARLQIPQEEGRDHGVRQGPRKAAQGELGAREAQDKAQHRGGRRRREDAGGRAPVMGELEEPLPEAGRPPDRAGGRRVQAPPAGRGRARGRRRDTSPILAAAGGRAARKTAKEGTWKSME